MYGCRRISMFKLPIDDVLQELKETLRTRTNAVLVAQPGAGKTTRIPLALLDEPWLEGRRILMLEPRRIAARSAARFMAASLGEQVGETVGYRVKLDSRTGPKTRIEVVTEGILTRMLQSDPALEQAGIVIFDEFHERNLHADLGLALCLQSQALLRDDLRILVMSATLDTGPVVELLGKAPIIYSEGRNFPIETHYVIRRSDTRIESQVALAIKNAIDTHREGDILAFLPGAAEIRRTEARLHELRLGDNIQIAPLHGTLSQEDQDRAISPPIVGKRKIVLATSIAETSLTVEGVRIVIDCGLMRVPRFSPRTGMAHLETIPVSRSSADQRRGRAGRLGPGSCYRLWTEEEHRNLAVRGTPEIEEADLAPLMLELAVWGVNDPSELQWLDLPPAAAVSQARGLLTWLGAISKIGTITAHGQQMAELGLHPRLSHMILRGKQIGAGKLACELAAILNERDFIRNLPDSMQADLRLRVETLWEVERSHNPTVHFEYAVDIQACRRVIAEAKQWLQQLRISPTEERDIRQCGILLAFAYPDRIAQRRGTGGYLLSNGRGAVLTSAQYLSNEPYLVAAELDDQGSDGRIYRAAPVELIELEKYFSEEIEAESEVVWDRAVQAVRARKREKLGAMVLKETQIHNPASDQGLKALVEGIQEEGLAILPWNKASRQLQQRMSFMHHVDSSWPEATDDALLLRLEDWLTPHLLGMKSRNDLQKLNVAMMLESWLSWQERKALDEYAPTHINVPSGSRIPIDYSEPSAPALAVRLQEMFGLADSPRIGNGRIPLTIHLLSPAQRPVQVTRDLASFWKDAYYEVKKDLKGRYPKHYWPEDPWNAVPTNRARPRH
jgi:ATP-dependent helicase HrpB